MNSKKKLPPKNYATLTERPPLNHKVEEALTNNYSNLTRSSYEGKCYLIKHSGAYYQGEWEEGLPNGKGIAIYKDGTYYEGYFEGGDATDNNGLLIMPNGACYKGQIRNSKIQGKGVLKQKRGQGEYSYDGEWKDGRPNGYGIQKYGDDNSYYKGYFVNGIKHCYEKDLSIKEKEKNKNLKKSTYNSGGSDPETYTGEFFNGLMHGFGQYTCHSKGVSYRGEFKYGQKEGHGTYETEKGKLTGNFKDDVINGEGTFEWRDGRRYEGEFVNSQFHGKGKVILTNGNILEGKWNEGHGEQLYSVINR